MKFRSLTNALHDAIRDANRTMDFARISGEPPNGYDDNECPMPGTPYDDLAFLLNDWADHVEFLKTHTHEWADDGFCLHCGADGNA